MNDNHIVNGIIRLPGPGCRTLSSCLPADLSGQLQKYMHTLGPTPKRALEAFADLGMTDAEICRYFRIPHDVVTQLREIWKIDGTD